MKLSLLPFLFAVFLAACSPGSKSPAVANVQAAEMISSKTVALVQDDETDGVRAFCTGVWVSEATILSANHCTNEADLGAKFLYVTEGDVYDRGYHKPKSQISTHFATLTASDPRHDLALFHVDAASTAHGVASVTHEAVLQGEPAQTVGQSLGLWYSFSSGDVSAIRWDDTGFGAMFWVQTTTPTSPGNSGGGLFNSRGELIGICHASYRRGQLVNVFVHPIYIESFLAENFLASSPH